MPNVTVHNLTSGRVVLAGGYTTTPLVGNGSVTLTVPDIDEFLQLPGIANLITAGAIEIIRTSGDVIDRPIASYTTAALPANVAANTLAWNTDTRTLWISDGTNWAPYIGGDSAKYTNSALAIPAAHFVGLTTAGVLNVESPAATLRYVGVTTEADTAGNAVVRVQNSGTVDIMPSSDIAAADVLVTVPGGFAAPYQVAAVSLGTAVAGADARDDIDQTNLPATVAATCAGNETGNTIVIYGNTAGGVVKETLALGTAGVYTSTHTWTAIYCLRTTKTSVNTISIRDGGAVGLLIPAIAGATAARYYGAIVPDVTTDSLGHLVQIAAGGANASDVMLWGTDYLGNEQYEVVTLNATAWISSLLPYRSLDRVFIGADGILWNAGVTSQYDNQVEFDPQHRIRGLALAAQTTPGSTVEMVLLPQSLGRTRGQATVYFTGLTASWNSAAAVTRTYTVPGIAATDIVQATMAASQNSVMISKAVYSAADTVTVTWSGAPGNGTIVGLTVLRP